MPTPNNDLLSIDKLIKGDGTVSAKLYVNTESEILKGHFPGQPVVPGACMLQIIKDVLESALNQPLRLKKADQLKFMIIIDPTNTSTVQLEVSYKPTDGGDLYVIAKLSNPDAVYFKFQGNFLRI